MQRGDLITVALQGDAGKPRPALVTQADHFANLPTLQATCCVKCRAGFGRDIPTMLEHRIGMFPVEGSERRFER